MPDFLHQGSPETNASHAEAIVKPNASPTAPKASFHSRRPGSSRATDASNEEGKREKKKVRQPSKLFVQYYGAVFLLLTTGFLLLGYLLLSPLITEFKSTNETIIVKLQELEDTRSFLDSLNRSIAAAEAIPAETLVQVDEALPRSIDIPKLLILMDRVARENDVSVSTIQFSPAEQSTPIPGNQSLALTPVTINLSINAPKGYASTRAYLQDLETSLRILDVKSINVTSDGSTGSLTYSLQLIAYAVESSKRSSASATPSAQFVE